MKRFTTLSLLLGTLALAACGGGTANNRTGETLADIVRAERGAAQPSDKCEVPANMAGRPHTDLATMKFKAPIRVIFPGTTVTGDQVSNRLNFRVDKKGIIREVTCG